MRAMLTYYMNPLHVYCRLRDLGLAKGQAIFVCRLYERAISKHFFMNDIPNVRQLTDLLQLDSSEDVLNEVLTILNMISPDFGASPITNAFRLTNNLYKGSYSGYRTCNTEYHDLKHTIDTFLAMARLIHGAIIDGESFTNRQIVIGIIAALLHDAGYIQEDHDREGTGSKYTTNHVQRSMDFLERHGTDFGLSNTEITEGRTIIHCTDPSVDIPAITFLSREIEILGKMLGAADLLAQMSDRVYLEKLLFLYHEFRQANMDSYENEVDLLQKTVGFFEFSAQRLGKTLDATDRFMISHMASRWGIQENLYQKAIKKHKKYLQQILEKKDSDPFDSLKRGDIVDKVRRKYGKTG